MQGRWWRLIWIFPLAVSWIAGSTFHDLMTAWAAPALYWCPNRPADQQYTAAPEPGCAPLVDKKDASSAKSGTPFPKIKVEHIQPEAAAFLKDYRQYVNCCANDTDSLDELGELENRATAILDSAQTGLFSEKMKLRGFVFSEVIPPVARARDQLREIRKRLELLAAAEQKLDQPDLESAARARRRVQDLEESIGRDFEQKSQPASPKTGKQIGRTPPTGEEIGKVPPTGAEFGTQGRTGRDLGYTPPTVGRDIGQNAPTGFEIGKTGVAGPAIGDSQLDRRPSDVSSTLGGSSVNSNFNSKPLGSNLAPSRIDSDLQSRPSSPPPDAPLSTIDSTLKNRSTQ